VNGDLIRNTGHGIEELNPRELCDVAYAAILDGLERRFYALTAAGAQWKDSEDPLGEQIERFEEKIGLRDDPNAWALAMHRQFMESQGREWDDTPVGAGSGEWWDQDVEFTSMSDLDKAAKRHEKRS
jgi:photosystem II stability/assembly factor-like uncharacterized protein